MCMQIMQKVEYRNQSGCVDSNIYDAKKNVGFAMVALKRPTRDIKGQKTTEAGFEPTTSCSVGKRATIAPFGLF